jgi:predicted MPP superfamily phosphohydrolase
MRGVEIILFLGACVGHTAIWVFSQNWWFGLALPHRFLGWWRNVHGLVVVGGWIFFFQTLGLHFHEVWPSESTNWWRGALALYAVLCWTIAFGLLPWSTMRRMLRRPQALAANHTRTLDVASQLGYKPIGRGKHRLLARLPGNNVFRVDFSEKILRLPGLPSAWDGVSVLHLSDLHLSGTPDRVFFEQVMDECRAWNPDIVVITGDYVDSEKHHRWIIPLLGRLEWRVGAVAILGNHDGWYDPFLVRRRLHRLGVEVLGNSWKQWEIHGEPLILIGNEAPWFRPAPNLIDCPEIGFRLGLSHTPDNIRWAQKNRIDLLLAGHNHGGQIRLPFIGSVLVPSRYGRRYDCGTFDEPPTVMHVSRGLGGQHPVRYGCKPEVTKLLLRCAGVC